MKTISLQHVETRRATSLRRGALSMAAAVMMLFATGVSAQVTIGSGKVPEKFSVLELISNNTLGLRLPQVNNDQRQEIEDNFGTKKTDEAMGLQIFNTDTRCVETWNGAQWIQNCPPEGAYVPPVALGVPSNCPIEASNGNMTFTAKADPNAEAYIFFVGGVSQGEQSSNVLTLASATDVSQVTVHYLYPSAFLKPKMIAVWGGGFTPVARTQASTNGQSGQHSESNPSVIVSDFYMSETEVTQAQFEAVMGVNPSVYQCDGAVSQLRVDLNGADSGGPDGFGASCVTARPTSALPVENVNFYDAIAYCNKLSLQEGKTPVYSLKIGGVEVDWENLAYADIPVGTGLEEPSPEWETVTQNLSANGYRLPTREEWEYAARGGLRRESLSGRNEYDFFYSGSNDIDEVAWYSGNNGSVGSTVAPWYGPKPVKTKKANALGLYDMTGNVDEWCWNPRSSGNRAVTGGNWWEEREKYYYTNTHNGVIYYYGNYSDLRFEFIGFRVVCSVVE